MKDMEHASAIFPVALMILLAKVGLGVGPKLAEIMSAKGTIFLQMFAHFLGTMVISLPIAMLLGLRRECVGACYSLGREAQVAIIAEKYGISSEEGHGVMGVFIVGTVLGALWTSIFTSVIVSLGIFHPYALALGAGTQQYEYVHRFFGGHPLLLSRPHPDGDGSGLYQHLQPAGKRAGPLRQYVHHPAPVQRSV